MLENPERVISLAVENVRKHWSALDRRLATGQPVLGSHIFVPRYFNDLGTIVASPDVSSNSSNLSSSLQVMPLNHNSILF